VDNINTQQKKKKGIKTEVKAPTDEKIKTVLQLEHVAYNIVFPTLGKEIDPKYRRKISDNITGIEVVDNLSNPGKYNKMERKIKIRRSQLNYEKIGKVLSAELGHALSPDSNLLFEPNIGEYYDFLAQKLGEGKLKNTKYAFKPRSIIERIENVYKIAKIVDKVSKRLDKFFDKLIDGEMQPTEGTCLKIQ